MSKIRFLFFIACFIIPPCVMTCDNGWNPAEKAAQGKYGDLLRMLERVTYTGDQIGHFMIAAVSHGKLKTAIEVLKVYSEKIPVRRKAEAFFWVIAGAKLDRIKEKYILERLNCLWAHFSSQEKNRIRGIYLTDKESCGWEKGEVFSIQEVKFLEKVNFFIIG